ncbi:MAG: thiamine pyrophosphate-dependent dehydrogenase E1 component subunit alpha [Deltaproteobacteria bacterium]|nr:thiamine pyrophosphate-dependent dehydrogenase E1 component subunit alpha [Deltaproteobacteria bacterium]
MDSLRGLPPGHAGQPALDPVLLYRLMAKSRALEERLVKMTKSADGYFWIGGPGEEAFNVPLGLLIKKGRGPAFDFLHLHYRSSAILTAMGMPMIDAIRQMASRATDPFSGGRNFVGHFAVRDWNVVPVTSPIETQYAIAPGTALAQLRHGGDAITIVNGGDAGTAEGDFATCLNWVSRPGRELPCLVIVTNNHWGISTAFDEVHGDRLIARRAGGFGIRWDTVDGNDAFAASAKLAEVFDYVRRTRKPFCLEAYVSRLHGHSSSSGGARVEEPDCLALLEARLIRDGRLTAALATEIREAYAAEALAALEKVRGEPIPDPRTIHDHVYAG